MAKKISNENDSMDINELASLNDDISPELIEQLQQQLTQNSSSMPVNEETVQTKVPFNVNDDTTLFEEPKPAPPIVEQEKTEIAADVKVEEPISQKPKQEPTQEKKNVNIGPNFDDNFIKKYKAKLNKQKAIEDREKKYDTQDSISNAAFSEDNVISTNKEDEESIEKISKGNITEKPITKEQKEYNDSLDFLDGNVKYSKYVIYIEPQNIDFIDSLTVKERKNLINRILKEQDDISVTKNRFRVINVIIRHTVIAILTIAISIPVVYWAINASLEATINNYRNSQTIFKTLYRENGKITNTNIKK